jgi:hypothetical protein
VSHRFARVFLHAAWEIVTHRLTRLPREAAVTLERGFRRRRLADERTRSRRVGAGVGACADGSLFFISTLPVFALSLSW